MYLCLVSCFTSPVCLTSSVSCLLSHVSCSPVSRLMSHISCHLSVVSCQLSLVACLMSPVSCLLSHDSCLTSLVLSPVSCLLSHISCLTSPVSCLLSHVSCFMSPVSRTQHCAQHFIFAPLPLLHFCLPLCHRNTCHLFSSHQWHSGAKIGASAQQHCWPLITCTMYIYLYQRNQTYTVPLRPYNGLNFSAEIQNLFGTVCSLRSLTS